MKIGDMLIRKSGDIGIIVDTEDNIRFDVYWTIEDKMYKCVHYRHLLELEREAKKLKSR